MDLSAIRSTVAANFVRVMEMIAAAELRGGGAPAGTELICVTKYAQMEWIEALLEAGAANLAENLLPQAADRFDELRGTYHSFRRHLIGPPQSRKIKLIPGHFEMVQAVDRLKVADILNEECTNAGQELDVLLQVNIAGEEQKHGVAPEEAPEAFGFIAENCPALHLRGLMAVPPWPNAYDSEQEFERETRKYFTLMKELFDRIAGSYPAVPDVDTLSLGMSQDFTWAIEEGATMVRVGSLLFEGLQ